MVKRSSTLPNPKFLASRTGPVVHLPKPLPVVLIHGGLYDEPPVTPESFWVMTGVAPMLKGRNVEVILHERPTEPTSWEQEAGVLAATIEATGFQQVALVAGSNGCSAALRLLVDRPDLVARTMLCWPATAGDPVVDELARIIISDVHGSDVADSLLQGSPIRGITAEELGTISSECVIYPSTPENQAHRRSTVMQLLATIPGVMMVGGSPEPFHDDFADSLENFVDLVEAFSKIHHDD